MEKDLTLLVVEDEPNARMLLEFMIAELPGFSVIAGCDNVDTAFSCISEKRPDAILLDIQMPQKDGFMLIEMMRSMEKIPEIIFITAHEQFAIRAIRASAFDYLLKPVAREELHASLCRLREKLKQARQRERLEQFLGSMGKQNRIRLNDRYGFQLINTQEIIFIKADGNYSEITLVDGPVKTVSMNLGKLMGMLNDPSFIRVSRSCLINKNFLIRVDRKNMYCELEDGKVYRCPVSKGYLRELEEGVG